MVKRGFTFSVKQAPDLEKKFQFLRHNFREALKDSAIEWEKRIKTRQFARFTRRSLLTKLRNRSGSLRDSLGWEMRGTTLKDTVVRMYSRGVPYARIQELGRTVYGRPWLSVPLSSTLTGSGFVRSDLQVVNRGSGWQTTRGEKTFTYPLRNKRVVATKRAGKLLPLRVLVRSVKLPRGRLGFFRTWKKLRPFRRKQMRRAWKASIAGRRL